MSSERWQYFPHFFNLSISFLLIITGIAFVPMANEVENPEYTLQKILGMFLVSLALGLIASFLGNFANQITSIIIILFLLGGQILLPQYIPEGASNGFETDPRREPHPFLTFAGKPNTLGQNELGYPSPLPQNDAYDEYRILMIGNSTTYNSNLSEHLASNLKTKRSNPQVYNWGVFGQNSGMEVSTLVHRASQYNPDLVILYNGAMDMWGAVARDARPGYPFTYLAYENAIHVLQKRESNTGAIRLILSESPILGYIFKPELDATFAPINYIRSQVAYGSPEWIEAVWTSYGENLNRACHVAIGFDFKLMVFLQPIEISTYPIEDDMGWQIYKGFQAQIAELAHLFENQPHCRFVDLSKICRPNYCQFVDPYHVDRETDTFIAQNMYEQLLQTNLIP